MKFSILVVSLVLVVAFMVTAGCTQNTTPPVVTPTPTASPTATQVQTPAPVVTTPRVGMGTPGPTEMLPVDYMLDFMVQGNGDTSNPYMAVTLRGGNGMNLDSRVDVTFTKPDGTSQQNYMLPPFYVGQQVTFPSSTYQNRVEIWVTAPTVGKVKTYDEIVPFKSINP
jgi:biopolymer transport protein ExbD